ncbi:MAG: hypothetical protein ACHQNT_05115 [Bacteroidia bacterium]
MNYILMQSYYFRRVKAVSVEGMCVKGILLKRNFGDACCYYYAGCINGKVTATGGTTIFVNAR